MNTVEINPLELQAEAARIAAEAPPEIPPAPAEPPPPAASPEQIQLVQDAEKGYKILALGVVSQGAALIVPNWQVTGDEKTALADSIVQALMLWFPDGLIPPKYMALLVVAACVSTIVMSRMDAETGALPPRYAPTKKDVPTTAVPSAATAAQFTHITPH